MIIQGISIGLKCLLHHIYLCSSRTTRHEKRYEKDKTSKSNHSFAATLGANGIILAEVNEPSEGSKIAGAIFGTGTTGRGHAQFESTPSKAQDSVQQETISPDVSNVSIEEKIDEQKEVPSVRLFYFRKVVNSAAKFTDRQILKFYRKKYPSLKSKPDNELISLIEKKYKEIFENN